MADLDDFFAKKDRKKKTSKKFTTTEEVAKKLEDTAKKTEKQKKERVPEGEEDRTPGHVSPISLNQVGLTRFEVRSGHIAPTFSPHPSRFCLLKDQDEWKEFEEEKKDYTGLKIGHLSSNPNQETHSANPEAGSGEQTDGGDNGAESDRKPGPWKRQTR